MSTSETQTRAPTHDDAHLHHPGPSDYVRIAVILGIITAAEIAASYVALPRFLFIGGLIVLSGLKFGMVVAFYMHLKFDNTMFRRLFTFGLILAVTVFLLVLGLFIIGPEFGQVAA